MPGGRPQIEIGENHAIRMTGGGVAHVVEGEIQREMFDTKRPRRRGSNRQRSGLVTGSGAS